MKSNKFSIVIPIRKHSILPTRNEFEQFVHIGLKSFKKFLDPESVFAIYVVSPQHELSEIEQSIQNLFLDFQFIYLSDEDVVGKNIDLNCGGWVKQQLIKLHIARHISTQYYIPLDGDHLLVKPLSYSDLFHEGKLTYSHERWQTDNSEAYSTNSRWWMESCSLLQVSPELVFNNPHLMGVTPQILKTTIVRDLLDTIIRLYDYPYQNVMVSNGFTEFSLYWVYMLSTNQTYLYTPEGNPLWKHDLLHNVLHRLSDVYRLEQIRLMVREPTSYFAVIQSYLGIPTEQLIKEYLAEN